MKFCYFGFYKPDFSVNKITISGLKKNGHEVVECQDSSNGLKKYVNLFLKHHTLKGDYDVLIVGYPGHVLVPFAKLISGKPVVADLIGSLEDADFYSHNNNFFRKVKNRLIDWLAVKLANVVILESFAQKKHFEERFGGSLKYKVIYTGADESVFYPVENVSVGGNFEVLFRGSLTPESGIFHILKTAELLKNEKNIKFKIIGRGYLLNSVNDYLNKNKPQNVDFISKFFPIEELRREMQASSISLGQFETNPRLDLTIPHKAFESMAMGIPYLSGNAPAVKEIITNGQNGFLCPLANPQALAEKIKALSTQPELPRKVSQTAKKDFDEKFSSVCRAEEIISISRKLTQGL